MLILLSSHLPPLTTMYFIGALVAMVVILTVVGACNF